MKVDVHSAALTLLSIAFVYHHWLIQELQVSHSNMMKTFLVQKSQSGPDNSQQVQSQSHSDASLRKLTTESTLVFPKPIAPKRMKIETESKRAAGGGKMRGQAIYGGAGDEVHLGGFTVQDNNTISYNTWNYMLGPLAVKSFIDIGCGRGFSAKYFKDNGARVTCVEGSHDAIEHSLLPRENIVQHDFTKGVWFPEPTYDVAWSTEFLEHVSREYMENYIPTLKRAAIIMVSASGWGGYHHVEVHERDWWVYRLQMHGLIYSLELTEAIRDQTKPDLAIRNGQVVSGIMVFINPSVASLPEHKHLVGGNGCYGGIIDNRDGGVACTDADALPLRYQSLLNCAKKAVGRDGAKLRHQAWKCERNQALAGGL